MKYITMTIISAAALYGSYMFAGYTVVALMSLLLCIHSFLSYYTQHNREEDFRPDDEHIPVIGGKKINWEEYREIPPDITPNGRVKFNRNNL